MKASLKRLLALSALGLSLGMTAYAQPMGDGSPDHGGARFEKFRAQMEKRHEKRLAALKEKLKLTPAQDAAWQQFASAQKPPAKPMMTPPDRDALAKLTTPERIDKMQQEADARHTAMMEHMKQRAEATKQFYAQLTPEQQKVFDAETLPPKRGEHMRKSAP